MQKVPISSFAEPEQIKMTLQVDMLKVKRQQVLPLLIILAVFLLILLSKKSTNQNSNFHPLSVESFRSLDNKKQINYLREMGQNTTIEDARNFLKTAYPGEPTDKHELIHAVGEAAYLKLGYGGLAKCDSTFMFGCYHGVILEAIKQNGYSQKVLDDLAKGCLGITINNQPANKTVTTACSHGIGHGIMVVRSYDLPAAYKDCDNTFSPTSQKEELFYCWDGVSMENIMRRFEQPGAEKFLKADDPYYPCNFVEEKYQAACAREHVFYIFQILNNKDTQKAIDFCMSFQAENTRFECSSAIGNFLNQAYFDNPDKVIAECHKLDGKYSVDCVIRAANQYAFSRQTDKATLLCNSLNPPADVSNCLQSVNYAKNAL